MNDPKLNNYDMSYSFDSKTLREIPNKEYSMKLGIEYLKEFLKDLKEPNEICKLGSELGYYQKIIGDLEASFYNLNYSLEIAKNLKDEILIFISSIRLAQTLQFMGNYDESSNILESLEKNLKGSLLSYQDFLFQHIGKNEFEKFNYTKSLEYLNKALDIRLKKGDENLISSTNLAIKRVMDFKS